MKLENVNELPNDRSVSLLRRRFQALSLNLRLIAVLEIVSGNIIASLASMGIHASGTDNVFLGIPHFYQFAAILAVLQIVGGIGMLFVQTWAFKMVTFTAVVRMVSIPIGTLWGAWIIYIFNKELR